MREQLDTAEQRLADLAARRYGIVTVDQLYSLGLDKSALGRRVRAGRLHRVHRGVYAVGHAGLSAEGWWMAAVLACGEGAVLSHRDAAVLWGLLSDGASPGTGGPALPVARPPVHITVPALSGRARRPGISLHRSRSLGRSERTVRRGIPVTTPARTVADLRGAVPEWEWRRAVRQAEFKGLDPGLRTDRTRSDLERDFLALCRRRRIPAPEVNVKVAGWTVDFLWRAQGIAVETDFYGYHRGRTAFRDDRARDLALRRRGFAVHRFSEEQLNEHPAAVVADLRAALGLGAAGAPEAVGPAS